MRTLLTPLLALVSFVYGWGLVLDRFWKSSRRKRLAKSVISIGNLTVGGTGKTPLLIKLCSDLVTRGVKPAVLTRGYQGAGNGSGFLNDEGRLLMKECPTVPIEAGKDRARAAENILKKNSVDCFVLDDGFQHWKVERDVDIVCIDGTNPWGGGHLLPWGLLRESKEGLARAKFSVLTRMELLSESEREKLKSEVRSLMPEGTILSSEFIPSLHSWSNAKVDIKLTLAGARVLAVSAVGNPAAFEEALRKTGAQVIPKRFRDHHSYTDEDLLACEKLAEKLQALIVTTAKDEVKMRETRWGRLSPGRFVWRINISFIGEDQKKWETLVESVKKN